MSRKTWTLIGLEHPVGENLLLSHLKIRLNIRRLDIHELRSGRWAVRRPDRARIRNQVGAVHFSVVIYGQECAVRVAQVLILGIGAGRTQVHWA